MSEAEKLVGLEIDGTFVEGDDLVRNRYLVAVATSKEALGMELNKFCVNGLPSVLNKPGDDLIGVVIGDPWLLIDVKVIAKGALGVIEMPEKVRKLLLLGSHRTCQFIVFENKDGSRVYVHAWYSTLLENVMHKINQELLPEHLKKA